MYRLWIGSNKKKYFVRYERWTDLTCSFEPIKRAIQIVVHRTEIWSKKNSLVRSLSRSPLLFVCHSHSHSHSEVTNARFSFSFYVQFSDAHKSCYILKLNAILIHNASNWHSFSFFAFPSLYLSILPFKVENELNCDTFIFICIEHIHANRVFVGVDSVWGTVKKNIHHRHTEHTQRERETKPIRLLLNREHYIQ